LEINDPFAAVMCVERLGEGLASFCGRKIPLPYRSDEGGKLRLVIVEVDFEDLADAALTLIRQFGSKSFWSSWP
jgi:uncharacterized membrane protein